VKSSGGPKVTILDGQGLTSAVTFSSNETPASVLSGLTIQNGHALNSSNVEGGGIAVESASPVIKNNIIQNNLGSNGGGGIGVGFASPLIQGNIIRNNSQAPQVSGGIGGAGISVRGTGSTRIIGNTIQNNTWNNVGAGFGGGISLFNSGSTLIESNIIEGNVTGTWGAAISMENDVSGTVIVQNLIAGNSSPDDAGIYWSNPPAVLVNNTITDGRTATGSSTSIVVANALNSTIVIANNVIVASTVTTNAFYCVSNSIASPSNFYNNDVFSTKGTAYGGMCSSQTGIDGNISISPGFVSAGNFRLKAGSPLIDVGSNTAPDLPSTDVASNPRIINGNGGSTAIVDIGAYEFVPVVLSPNNLNFGPQGVGSTTSKTVKLTNAQSRVLNISSIAAPMGYSVTGCGPTLAAFTSCTLTVTFHPLTVGIFKGALSIEGDAPYSPQMVTLSGNAR
jgi:parallel beta helix pectate lyase-like protein/ASPM-SPD-2-Hydin domain-containing protein